MAATKSEKRFKMDLQATFTDQDTGKVGAAFALTEGDLSWDGLTATQDGLADMLKARIAATRKKHVK